MITSRRTVVRGATWTAPVVALSAKAPAFAASALLCRPTGCKLPGLGKYTKDYVIRPDCVSGVLKSVEIYDDRNRRWVLAISRGDGSWITRGFNDSRRNRQVRLTSADGQQATYAIAFSPC